MLTSRNLKASVLWINIQARLIDTSTSIGVMQTTVSMLQ